MVLASSLSEEEVALLIADLPDRQIPTHDHLSYHDFLNLHLIPNEPFLLSSTSTSHWPSRKEWAIAPDSDDPGSSYPNLSALRKYGDQVVPVADTTRRAFSEFERRERPLSEVLELWECDGDQAGGLYVKDWHLLAEVEEAGGAASEIYEVPECFREDWLNLGYLSPRTTDHSGLDASQSDFRFTYLGPRGTFTPLHRDVYASYSWSANIVGRKMWWLFPPDPEILGGLGIAPLGEKKSGTVFDVRCLQGDMEAIKILQNEGEVIFVPSGWYHQVVNLDFCISINHNFIAPATLSRVYDALVLAQTKVEESISDVRDMIRSRLGIADDSPSEDEVAPEWEVEWVEEVQKLLEMDAGWSWKGYWECVKSNLRSPPTSSENSTPVTLRNSYIEKVLERYKWRREWITLPEVRTIISDIEYYLSISQN